MQRISSNNAVRLIVLAAISTGIGCAGPAGPVNSDQFETILRDSIPMEGETLLLHGKVEWFPNLHSIQDLIDQLATGLPPMFFGALVVTDQAISLVRWDGDSRHYVRSQFLPLTEFASSRVDTRGRGRALIIQRKDLSVVLVSFHDGSQANEAHELLAELRRSHEPSH